MEATREGQNLDASLMAKRCTDSSEWKREGEDDRRIPDNSTIFQYGANEGYVNFLEGGSRSVVTLILELLVDEFWLCTIGLGVCLIWAS